MILVIGGSNSGKLEFIKKEYGYDNNDIADGVINEKPVIYNLQNIDNVNIDMLLNKEVIICNEIGCGIVPVEKCERDRREKIGRLCIELAKYAKLVIRVQCGIPIYIKK